ncbi:MAG TPA: pirin family protein [Pyrinomonadaceae bacterium]|nr:pirin family protein [Pyrinomonadaceae bacterium]
MNDRAVEQPAGGAAAALETVVVTRTSELVGGFGVRRALPSRGRRMVGPFVFLDQMGPEVLRAGAGLDVPPHPHIGLATVTYLFGGELLHRDGLGTAQLISPGEVNWMTAGRGIAHSERTPPASRGSESELFGIQSWVALPAGREEDEPCFAHHAAAELPLIEGEGKAVRVVAGSLYGARSPVETLSGLFYADASLESGATLAVPSGHEERAAYVVSGSLELVPGGEVFEAGRLLVFRPGAEASLRAAGAGGARLMLLGGEPLEGPRHVWWNFVSSSRERIEQAKEDWREGRFAPVPGETDFVPLPGSEPAPVRYP